MLNRIKKSVLGSKALSSIYFLVIKLRNRGEVKEIERRKHTPLFNYKELARPLNLYPYFNIKDNNLYGIGKVFQEAGLELDIDNCLIEHGLILGDLVQKHNHASYVPKIVTFSEYRRHKLRKKLIQKEVSCVGPYIKYANTILKEEDIAALRNSLGKTLVVFPSHSNDVTIVDFNSNDFIKKICEIAVDYDSVIICMYWKDIELGRAEEYIKKGFKVTCAGHIYDRYFLDRLKTIILLSDFTMSNNVGTHIGYCICLGKGHFLFRQNLAVDHGLNLNEANQRDKTDWDTYNFDVEIISKCFINNFNVNPSLEQIEIVSKYWGDIS
ncbi:hypothetical protein DN752_19950 [Echinicola strongylocentroti]|uniref:Uncharacterized protein n=1 Tax=Echinicola strongylocentroti TaxID=1795355 RepID=A0A2Z4INB2_9BACT|nr:hypothetical protein [Echinicola strongylocentroti]AWW32229.1 hypothetical protein DN752_19950 [Echinicola strongylocentroti]